MKDLNILSKIVARENGFNEDEAIRVNGFFWKDVRRTLTSLDAISIAIKHIGTVTTSKRKVDYFIQSTINKIRNIQKSTRYKESTKSLLLDVNFDRLRKALKQRNILATQYHEAYISRRKRVLSSPPIDSLTVTSNIGGNHKPSEE